MNTGARITVFAAALAATFGTAYGVGTVIDPVSPAASTSAHGERHTAGHGDAHAGTGGGREETPPGGLEISRDGYTLDLKTPRVEAGRTTDLRFAVVQDGTGRNVTAYQRQHDKELHLIVASRDLTVFRHLHPVRAADGTWSTPLDLPRAGGYRVFADFKPTGGDALTLGADLAASGPYRAAGLPETGTTATVDGYRVRLAGTLTPGRDSELTLTVSRDGKPVRDLQPYLGAYGHLVALRAGDLAYLHVHPGGEPGDGTTRPGPAISFTAMAPSPGAYRLFLDFRHEGKVHTAAFTVHAGGPAATPSTKEAPAPSAKEEAPGHTH
ncbi:hypothetical protein C3489_27925 [Streptomyces sp. Ru71]|uniref:hypothetical protein n=1 Tax=Streptomyces sp. Ru71 TaxID=2080746 RepID=UPI000CDD2F28|nr:hypothetical protein [Streptomyces sp. Ru71]POX48069.1 hypothetical protein C3489_27925 [Streptomyces sp. Ru71]